MTGISFKSESHAVASGSLAENTRARLTAPCALADGRTVPAGSSGTIVGIWAGGVAYEVEFIRPFHAVVTVVANSLVRADAVA